MFEDGASLLGSTDMKMLRTRNCPGPGFGSGLGGAIFTDGSLVVRHSVITHNTARSGGGIYVATPGTLTLKHSTVIDNTPDDIFP
jgi:predicted outer membrane repeat protein